MSQETMYQSQQVDIPVPTSPAPISLGHEPRSQEGKWGQEAHGSPWVHREHRDPGFLAG